MKRASFVVALLGCVFCALPTAHASGSYGAVVEKGVRGCTTDHETGIVICFESPTVNARSRGVFLQVWPAASHHFRSGDGATVMLRVRSLSAERAGTPVAGQQVISYAARADRVLPLLGCRDDLRFHASHGTTRLESIVSECTPRRGGVESDDVTPDPRRDRLSVGVRD